MCRRSQRTHTGFTLSEVLIAVAVLVVLLGLAIPAVVSAKADLDLTELDAYAKTIYQVAQTRLTALKTGGSSVADWGSHITAAPSDFPASLSFSADGGYVYLLSSDAHMEDLVPLGSMDDTVRQGYFVVEFNRTTGVVYGVFYSRSPITYTSADDYRLSREDRLRDLVGYFGGSAVKAQDTTASPLTVPEITLVNYEELYLAVPILDGDDAATYTVTVRQVGGSAVKEFTFSYDDGVAVSAYGRYPDHMSYDIPGKVYYLLLDSMNSGRQFKDLFSEFTPGCDLTVTVVATPVTQGKLPVTKTFTSNSLFASVSGGVASLSCGRHLQNLNCTFSGADTGLGITAARQTADIYWAMPHKLQASLLRSGYVHDDARLFQPIYTNGTWITSFDGGGNALVGLKLDTYSNSAVALFAKFNNTDAARGSIANVELVGVTAAGTISGGAMAGPVAAPLAAYLSYTDVSNCHVYTDKMDGSLLPCSVSTQTAYTGGLVGVASHSTLTNCSASLLSISYSGSGFAAGGLVGYLEESTLTGSYADTGLRTLDGAGEEVWTGGLKGQTLGGLVGVASGSQITDCYAVGYLDLSETTLGAGFATSDAGTSVTTSYSVMAFSDDLPATGSFYAFTDGQATISSVSGIPSCFYPEIYLAPYTAVVPDGERCNYASSASAAMMSSPSLASSLGGSWTRAVAATTTSYGVTGLVYPFPKLSGSHHYGDWSSLGAPPIQLLFAYYEIYSDNTYGYYVPDAIDTLRYGYDVLVKEDGYAFLATDLTLDSLSGTYKDDTVDGNGQTFTLSSPLSVTLATLGGDPPAESDVSYKAFLLRPYTNAKETTTGMGPVLLHMDCGGLYPTTISVDGGAEEFLFIPQFAKSNGLTSYDALSQYVIRSARHLSNLSQQSSLWGTASSKYSFSQELDVSFAAYCKVENGSQSLTLSPIGSGPVPDTPFYGTYNGNCHAIYMPDAGMGGTVDYCGLFGNVVSGTLKNITLLGNGDTHIAGYSRVAPLAASMSSSTVDNCAVAGFRVTGGSDASLGGLVGYAAGSCQITSCAVASGVFGPYNTVEVTEGNAAIMGTNAYIGGLVGTLDGGTSTIKNCYALVTTHNGRAELDRQSCFVANAKNGGTANISYCYAAGYSTGTNQTLGFTQSFLNQTVTGSCRALDGTAARFDSMAALQTNAAYGGKASPAFPFDSATLGSMDYPFPAVVKRARLDAKGEPTGVQDYVHYGDWPYKKPETTVLLAYYEIYSGDSTVYFTFQDDSGLCTSTSLLKKGYGKVVKEDGYVLLVDGTPPTTLEVTYTGGTDTLKADHTLTVNKKETAEGTGVDTPFTPYYLRPDEAVLRKMVTASPISSTLEVTVNETDYSFSLSPAFAPAYLAPAPDSSTLSIRSARHLSNLSKFSSLWSGKTAEQLLDVNFAAYKAGVDVTLTPIGNGGTAFTGIYNGWGHTITTAAGISGTHEYAGLFGSVGSGGTVNSVIFLGNGSDDPDPAPAPITGSQYVGGFVGLNNGTITNCMVSGFAVKGTGSASVGGFVGWNQAGTIQQCAAVLYSGVSGRGGSLRLENTSSNSGILGGFCGKQSQAFSGYAALTERCYAMVSLSYSHTPSRLGAIGGDMEGYGVLGISSGAETKNCYVFAYDTSGTGGWQTQLNGYTNYSNNGCTNCYAYSGGTFSFTRFTNVAGSTFPFSDALNSKTYPYPAIVQRPALNDDGTNKMDGDSIAYEYVHFGDWYE